MKKLLSIVSTVAISAVTLTACSSNSGSLSAEQQLQAYKDSIKLAADTAGLSEFRQYKAYNELSNAAPYQNMEYAAAAAAPVARSYSSAPRRSYASSSSRRSSGYSGRRSRSYGGGGYSNSTASYPAKKKGWSKAAKGAVIGGAGGAIAGAVINKKNRAVGAVVGGILGGGGGYVIGRQMDKRDGRY
jgi:hypothetical protein